MFYLASLIYLFKTVRTKKVLWYTNIILKIYRDEDYIGLTFAIR